MMKDLKSDESRYPEIKLNKYTFKVLKNQELPGQFFIYDRVDLPDKINPLKKTKMLYNQRSGELSYFPRIGSFEIYFNNELLYSRLEVLKAQAKLDRGPDDIIDFDSFAKYIVQKVHEFEQRSPTTVNGPHKIKTEAFNNNKERRFKSLIGTPAAQFKSQATDFKQKPGSHLQSLLPFRSITSLNKDPNHPQSNFYEEALRLPAANSAAEEALQARNMLMNGQQFSYNHQKTASQTPVLERLQQLQKKSLERFNKVVNQENDMKFQQLISHRRFYNGYIQVGADTRKGKEEMKKQMEIDFDEAIKKKVEELRSSKTRMETEGILPQASPKSQALTYSPIDKDLYSKGRRQNSIIKQAQKKLSGEDQNQLRRMVTTFSGLKIRKTSHTRRKIQQSFQLDIDRAYQLQVPIGKTTYKKIVVKNDRPELTSFTFQTSNADDIQILNESKVCAELLLSSGQSGKPIVRFSPKSSTAQRQYIVYVFANGQKYQNILLSVEFVEE